MWWGVEKRETGAEWMARRATSGWPGRALYSPSPSFLLSLCHDCICTRTDILRDILEIGTAACVVNQPRGRLSAPFAGARGSSLGDWSVCRSLVPELPRPLDRILADKQASKRVSEPGQWNVDGLLWGERGPQSPRSGHACMAASSGDHGREFI